MAESARYRALEEAGLLHPAPDAVRAEAFVAHPEFFACFDKVQVKYEMLRAHVLDGETATAAAAAHGYSRASFYSGHGGVRAGGDGRVARRAPGAAGSAEALARGAGFLQDRHRERPGASAVELASELERAMGVSLHRRTVERVLGGRR